MNYTMLTRLYRNGRIAIQLMEDNGESYGMLSTNIDDAPIGEDMITVPVWNLRDDLVAAMLATGRFEETGHGVRTGHAVAPLWRVVCPTLLAEAAEQRERIAASASVDQGGDSTRP